jgi:phospholipid/cholesterol/gamma-HCH transport system substrate-binding protein
MQRAARAVPQVQQDQKPMTQRRSFQIGTGLFILLGFTALAYLATQTTSVANFSQGPSYTLKARFNNIGQLKLRAPVKLAGVRIGSVKAIDLDTTKLDANVQISIDNRYKELPDDSAAAIFTSGLLGDQYVSIQPGGSPTALKDGDEFVLTQSSIQLEDLIGKFLVSGGPSKPADSQAGDAAKDAGNPAEPKPDNGKQH